MCEGCVYGVFYFWCFFFFEFVEYVSFLLFIEMMEIVFFLIFQIVFYWYLEVIDWKFCFDDEGEFWDECGNGILMGCEIFMGWEYVELVFVEEGE